MRVPNPVSTAFGALAVAFLVLTLLDMRWHGVKMTPARRAWLRTGVIFAAIAIFLFVFQRGH
jgi:hypothetical protein